MLLFTHLSLQVQPRLYSDLTSDIPSLAPTLCLQAVLAVSVPTIPHCPTLAQHSPVYDQLGHNEFEGHQTIYDCDRWKCEKIMRLFTVDNTLVAMLMRVLTGWLIPLQQDHPCD